MDIQEIRQQHDEGADRNALSYWSHNEMEVVLARVRELEAVLALLADDDNWDYIDYAKVWSHRDAKGQGTDAQEIARAILAARGLGE